MVRKIVMGVIIVLILAIAGAYVLLKTKGDVLLQKFGAYVEESTGAPLVMDTMPSLTFFPQLGLDLGRASWGRRGGDVSVRFERASVRVAATALLTGRLDITDMEVDGLDLTARMADATARTGPTAPSSATAVSAPDPAPADAPASRSAADLEAVLTRILTVAPNALTIRDGRINLIRPGGSTTEFSHLNLTLKNVRPGADTGLNLKADVRGSQPDFSGVLELNAGAALADSGLKVSLRKAVFTPGAGLPVDAPVTLSGEGRYSLRDGTLNLANVTFSSAVLRASLSGNLASLPALARDPVHARGTSSLRFKAEGSPRAVLNILGLAPPRVDPAVLAAAALSGDLTLDQGVLKLANLDGSLDATNFGGNLEYRPHPLALSGELQVADVLLDAYLPPSRNDPAAPSPAEGAAPAPSDADGPSGPGQVWTAWPELHLALRVHSVEGNGIRVEDIQTRLEGKDGAYALNPLTCRAFGSPVTASATADMKRSGAGRDTAAAVAVNLSAPQIDLRHLSTALFPAIPLEGVGTLNTSLACSTGNPLATLSGKGSLSAAPVTVHVDVLPPNAPVSAEAARNTRFDKAMLTFTASDGVITITDCTLAAPRVNAAGRGIINLPTRTLDLSGTVQLPGLAVLPVRLTGPLSAPTYSLNARTTFEAVDRTLKEQGVDLRQEIQKGLGRLFQKK